MNGSTDWKDYWLKGKENLDAARWALEKKQYNVCASRASYAVFLASIAALGRLQTRIHFCTRSKERLGSGAPVFV